MFTDFKIIQQHQRDLQRAAEQQRLAKIAQSATHAEKRAHQAAQPNPILSTSELKLVYAQSNGKN